MLAERAATEGLASVGDKDLVTWVVGVRVVGVETGGVAEGGVEAALE